MSLALFIWYYNAMSYHVNQTLFNLFILVDSISIISYAFFVDLIFSRIRILKFQLHSIKEFEPIKKKRVTRYSRWSKIYTLQYRATHESIASWPISWVSWVTVFYITEFWTLMCSPVADCLVLQVNSRVSQSSCSSWMSKPNPNTLKAYKIHKN